MAIPMFLNKLSSKGGTVSPARFREIVTMAQSRAHATEQISPAPGFTLVPDPKLLEREKKDLREWKELRGVQVVLPSGCRW